MNTNTVRIIAGKWRGRKISFPDSEGLRPTPDRARETLFNWLMPEIHEADCLDCFAGSGALGFEALSRGATSVTMIENQRQAYQSLCANQTQLQADNLHIHQANFLNDTELLKHDFDIIFLDPPFQQNLIHTACQLISSRKLLRTNGLIYVETHKSQPTPTLDNCEIIKQKTMGDISLYLLACRA